MAIADYNKALKAGEKEYRSCLAKGIYPYLPVLDDILSHEETDAQISLGLVQIPMRSIVGTYSSGRTTAFARNFMPILDNGSEFAMKWAELYDMLAEEGLRDPIKAYEYGNRFYVMEGNKRVSVLKMMDAVSIEAYVTRVIPKRKDTPENRLYYEFLDFYELTEINYVEITREGNFRRLLEMTYGSENKWTVEQKQDFNSLYTFFEQEFAARSQNKLSIEAGDALCLYLEVFGFEEAKEKSQNELRHDLMKIWNEILALDSGEEARLILNPTEESQKISLMKLFPVGTPVLKVAFIHERSVQNSPWIYSHELGRKYIQDVFGDKIEASCIERVDGDNAEDVLEAAIEAGNKVIFVTSPKLGHICLKAAVNHPDIKILNCSMNLNHKAIRCYYLRMYEAKFISGAIAGAMSETGRIGYVADYPIHGTTAEINAFALGVQMTNPRATVSLEWIMEKDKDFREELKRKQIELVSGRDFRVINEANKEFGLFKIMPDGNHINLAMPVRHWGKLYEEIIRSIMKGGYKNDDTITGNQALNYFWGMSSGAIDVIYSRKLPVGCIRMLRNLREGIRNMDINPFTGPFYSQDGMCRCEDGHGLSPEECIHIDWLLDNIEGYIPDSSQLKQEAVELVRVQGIKSE